MSKRCVDWPWLHCTDTHTFVCDRRVGFVEVRANVELPASIDDIEKHFDVAEKVPTAPPWDFMWTVVAEEAREKQFVHNAFTSEVADLPPVTSYDSDFLQVAEAAVKVGLTILFLYEHIQGSTTDRRWLYRWHSGTRPKPTRPMLGLSF